jgi:hypothetical protein
VAFSHDGRTVVTAEHLTASVRCFDTATGKTCAPWMAPGWPSGTSPTDNMQLAVSPNGKLVAVNLDGTVFLLRLAGLLKQKAE